MLTRRALLDGAEALAAVLDRDVRLLAELARRDPIGLEQTGWDIRDRARGRDRGDSWREALVAAELIGMVARGEPVPRLAGAKADMIAGVQDVLIRLATEGGASRNRQARRPTELVH